jgi:pimeloyl-ACP methyl ester carboxylesterase
MFLDCVEILSGNTGRLQKWIVYFNANGVIFELDQYATALRVNLLAVNYRGVGGSRSSPPLSGQDLVEDGVASVQYLLSKYPNLKEQDIMLQGHSMGG